MSNQLDLSNSSATLFSACRVHHFLQISDALPVHYFRNSSVQEISLREMWQSHFRTISFHCCNGVIWDNSTSLQSWLFHVCLAECTIWFIFQQQWCFIRKIGQNNVMWKKKKNIIQGSLPVYLITLFTISLDPERIIGQFGEDSFCVQPQRCEEAATPLKNCEES